MKSDLIFRYVIKHKTKGYFNGYNGFGTLYITDITHARLIDSLENAKEYIELLNEKKHLSILKISMDIEEVK